MRWHRIPPLTSAERFFLALLRDAATADARLPTTPLNGFWPRVQDLIDNHRLGGFIFAHCRDAAWWERCPPSLRAHLTQRQLQLEFRNTLFHRDLERVLAELNRRGIVPVLLKGPALNLTVYGSRQERAYADMDLLVHPDELEAAHGVMLALGFGVDTRLQPAAFYRQHHFHLIFRQPERPWCCFEIHWDLAIPAMDTAFRADDLMTRAESTEAIAHACRIPAAEDFLLHLCLHASLCNFSYLAQLRDVHALVVNQGEALDRTAFWRRARRYRISRPALACLELASLFGPHPALEALHGAAPDPGRAHAMRALLKTETVLRQRLLVSAAGSRAISLQRRDRQRDRWAVLARQVWPSARDLGLDGHPLPAGARPERRRFQIRGLGLVAKIGIYLLLARCGWEFEPRPNGPGAAPPTPGAAT